MEFQDVVDRRRMVRNYADRPVDAAVVERALRNATRAPSAGFSQGWAFVLLDRPPDVRRYWEATTDPAALAEPDAWLAGMMRAPVIVLPCSSKAAYLDRYAEPDKGWTDRDEARWPMPYWHLDTAMASLLILQTAVDAGLGALFFGVPPDKEPALRATFGIPDSHDPIGAITIGHRAEGPGVAGSPARRRRVPVAEVVHRGGWRGELSAGPEDGAQGAGRGTIAPGQQPVAGGGDPSTDRVTEPREVQGVGDHGTRGVRAGRLACRLRGSRAAP